MRNTLLFVFLLLAAATSIEAAEPRVATADPACSIRDDREVATSDEPRTQRNRMSVSADSEEDDAGCLACYRDYYFGPVAPRLIVGGDAKFAMCKAKYCVW